MANVTVNAVLGLSNGMSIDLSTTMAEGTESELQTSTAYSASAVSLGNYADGMVLSHVIVPPTAPNGIAYAYIDRRGEIAQILPVAIAGVYCSQYAINFRLQAGDTLRVLANTSANRTFAYAVTTATGVNAIFSGTPTGAGDTDLTHIKSGQQIGQSLTGQIIQRQYATSIDGSKLSTNGVVILNEQGLPYGGCPAVNPSNTCVSYQMVNYKVALNYLARVTTSS